MVQYLLWRSMTERHTRITLSFFVVGHTKFSPDWCFGLLKRLYRRTVIGSLNDIAEVVEKSASCNTAQLMVNSDGEVIVPMYDWASFFAPLFKKLPEIKVTHHFQMCSSMPCVVVAKNHSDFDEKEHKIIKDGV